MDQTQHNQIMTNLTPGTKVHDKRAFERDSRNGRSNKRRTHQIPLDTSFVIKDSSVRDDGDVEDGYETESTIAKDFAVKDNIHPPHPTRAGTLDPCSTTQEDPLGEHELNRALLQISPKPTIVEAKVGTDGELFFMAGFESPVWVSYIQVKGNHHVQAFMEALTRPQWKDFLTGGEKTRREPAYLGCNQYSQQMEVTEVLQMKKWDGKWMFEIWATGLVLDEEAVYRMELVDDAVGILYENSGEAQVVDEVPIVNLLRLQSNPLNPVCVADDIVLFLCILVFPCYAVGYAWPTSGRSGRLISPIHEHTPLSHRPLGVVFPVARYLCAWAANGVGYG